MVDPSESFFSVKRLSKAPGPGRGPGWPAWASQKQVPLTISMLPCRILKHAWLDSHPSPDVSSPKGHQDTRREANRGFREVTAPDQITARGGPRMCTTIRSLHFRREAGTEVEAMLLLQDIVRILWCRDVTRLCRTRCPPTCQRRIPIVPGVYGFDVVWPMAAQTGAESGPMSTARCGFFVPSGRACRRLGLTGGALQTTVLVNQPGRTTYAVCVRCDVM